MKNEEKTNVMRLLESRKIPYASYTYAADPSLSVFSVRIRLSFIKHS